MLLHYPAWPWTQRRCADRAGTTLTSTRGESRALVSGPGIVPAMLIDCDIHVGYDSLLDLVPYLDGPTRELVTHSGVHGLAMPSYPWYHPTGWIRKDAYDRDAAAVGRQIPGQSLATVRRLLLDPYDVTLRHPDPRRGGGLLDHPQRAPRGEAGLGVQRLAARALAAKDDAPARR